jgi:hypothetical protein
MNPIKKIILLSALFFLLGSIVFIVLVVSDNKRAWKDERKALSLVGNVQFRGHVIHHKVYDFAGKQYYMVCIKLDYTNVTTFYELNDLCFLKIKDGIATMANGVFNPYYGIPDYIEVNVNNDLQEKFFYKGGKETRYGLSLANYNLSINDINECN